MSWRIVSVTSRAKLDYKMDYLVVRTADDTKRIHISEISILVIESSAVSLTAYLLCELNKRKIDIIFCDEKRFPYGMLMPLYGSHDTSRKVRSQIKWTDDSKADIWANIIRMKIYGQMSILQSQGKEKESMLLSEYISQILPGDSSNREGHAAKVYFNALFGKDFSRDSDIPLNACLNYGYSILLSVMCREIVSNGYITQLGIFHDNVFNEYNLASDFIEPFRPFVDYIVISSEVKEFGKEERRKLVGVLNQNVIQCGRDTIMLNALKVYVKSVLDALSSNDISLIKYPLYEFSFYENNIVL